VGGAAGGQRGEELNAQLGHALVGVPQQLQQRRQRQRQRQRQRRGVAVGPPPKASGTGRTTACASPYSAWLLGVCDPACNVTPRQRGGHRPARPPGRRPEGPTPKDRQRSPACARHAAWPAA
jgi:hypothetical protein